MAEKRELLLDILAKARTTEETNKAARDLDKVGKAADDAEKHTGQLGKTTEETSKSQERLGKSAGDSARRMDSLNREIHLTNRELVSLHESYADTADETERRDLGKGIRRMEADLRRLTKTRDALTKDAGGGKKNDQNSILAAIVPDKKVLGKEFSQSIGEALSEFKWSGSVGGPVLAGIGIAVTPVLGGAIGAAVIGGAAGVGIVGGALLAARDQRVKDAGTQLGANLLNSLESRSKGFVKPILASIDEVQSNFDTKLGPTVSRLFANTAPLVAPLTKGVLSAVNSITSGIADAAASAGPVIQVIGTRVAGIGDAVGDLFTEMGKHGVDAASALDTALSVVEGTIRLTTEALSILITAYGFLAQAGAFGSEARIRYLAMEAGAAQDAAKAVNENADATKGMSAVSDAAGAAVNGLVTELGKSAEINKTVEGQALASARALHGQRDAMVDLSNAERAQTDPVFALLDAQDRLKTSQDTLSEAIGKHGRNSKEARSATKDLTGAALDLQTAAGQLGGTFNGKLTPQLYASLHAAGLTDAEIDQVAGSFRSAKRAGDDFSGNYNATVTLRVRQIGSAIADAASGVAAALKKRAAGGPVSRGTPYLVGEEGPEIVVPSAAGRVLSAAATRGVAKTGLAGTPVGAGGGGGSMLAQLSVSGGADQAVATLINYLIRTDKIQIKVVSA